MAKFRKNRNASLSHADGKDLPVYDCEGIPKTHFFDTLTIDQKKESDSVLITHPCHGTKVTENWDEDVFDLPGQTYTKVCAPRVPRSYQEEKHPSMEHPCKGSQLTENWPKELSFDPKLVFRPPASPQRPKD